MKKQNPIVLPTLLALCFSQGLSIGTTPSSLPSDVVILRTLTSFLESNQLQPLPRQDEDEENSSWKNVFPGVASIILGVATGDLRRVVEDGIFSFLGQSAQTQAFAVFHNLLGRTTQPPTTTTKKTTKPRRRIRTTTPASSPVTPDPESEQLSTSFFSRRSTVLPYQKVSRIPVYRIRSKTSSTLTTPTSAVTNTTIITADVAELTESDPDPEPDPDSDEEELAARFEQALRPYLPSNPDDAIPEENPNFVS